MFASEQVMKAYLSQLLNDSEPEEVVEKSPVMEPEAKITTTQKTSAVNSEPERIVEPVRPIEPVKAEPKLRPIRSRLTELKQYEEPEVKVNLTEPNSVEKLLAQVELKQAEEKIVKEQTQTVDLVKEEVVVESQVEQQTVVQSVTEDEIPEEPFQALFFDVAGLVLAVPLKELGGIHNLEEVNTLFGKPSWYKGVMVNREKKLNVVDSAKWVMPEKYDKTLEQAINYKYLITLGTSDWGLAAERLVETETIQPEDVKWRKEQGKRPWLFGTIKEKMCALLHVSDLIAMLEQGVNARHE